MGLNSPPSAAVSDLVTLFPLLLFHSRFRLFSAEVISPLSPTSQCQDGLAIWASRKRSVTVLLEPSAAYYDFSLAGPDVTEVYDVPTCSTFGVLLPYVPYPSLERDDS